MLNNLEKNISVIGLGYVGLPLALLAAKSGFKVFGIDTNNFKVNFINSGKSPIEDISDGEIVDIVNSGKLEISCDFSRVRESSIVIICVPTPLGKDKKPDLSYVSNAVISFSKYLNKSSLVILESTVQPGTTRDFLRPLIEENSNLNANELDIAYSPERIDPLNKKWNLKNTPKIVSGINGVSTEKAVEFYSNFVDNIHVCQSPEIAELAKLLENSFRYVNISFINEFSVFCQKIGIDVNDVIKAASTKPYGFMPFYPSVGVGGHCIPVDPLYLAQSARAVGAPTRFIELADEINLGMPTYYVGRASEMLGGLKDKKVLVIGVSYNPNVADVRETPVEALISGLKQSGAVVSWHDDLVKSWNGESSVALGSGFDLAILATPHDYLDLSLLGSVPVLNTRGSK